MWLPGLVGVFLESGPTLTRLACPDIFQNPDHQVVMPTVAADVAFGLGR